MSTASSCLIATFYAYKGGTGRTLTLANVARYLADEMGYRVGLVDLDIDSPGLVHEALCAELDSGRSKQDQTRRDELLKEIDDCSGFLDLFLAKLNPNTSDFNDVRKHAISLNSGCNGSIILMPAAKGSVSKSHSYGPTVEAFMHELSVLMHAKADSATAQTPGVISNSIFTDFIDTYELDYLFLDGRTGTGPFFPVYVYSIPHLLILFVGLNDQNISGSLSVLNAEAAPDGLASAEVPAILVASPVPTVGPGQLEERLQYIAHSLRRLRDDRVESRKYIYCLPREISHQLPYSDAAAFGEVYFYGRYPHSLLASAHEKLARSIEKFVLRDTIRTAPTQTKGDDAEHNPEATNILKKAGVTLTIATEDVHRDLLESEVSHLSTKPELRFFGAEDSDSPWMAIDQLLTDKKFLELEQLLADEHNLPDILMIPQSYLVRFSDALGGKLLWDVNELRDTHATRAPHLTEMDRNFPDWRRWCTVGSRVTALPFSVNATLLCVNQEAFASYGRAYWTKKYQKPSDPFFVPSSWRALIDVLRNSNAPRKSSALRIVGEDRGLYYEWLNVVTSMGGYDLEQVEGRLIQSVGLGNPETIAATELFRELARLSKHNGEWAKTMNQQIKDFRNGMLPLYLGWNDSFRFNSESGSRRVSVVGQAKDSDQNGFTVRLARCPRDMRYQRSSLVDGWLMTFPRKGDTPHLISRSVVAIHFAFWLLEAERQTRMVTQGFPSGSHKAVVTALESLRVSMLEAASPPSGADYSFRVFLETLQSALTNGKWVPSPGSDVSERIVETIARLINSDKPDVVKNMTALSIDVRRRLDKPVTATT